MTPWLNPEIPPKYDSSLAPTIEVIAPTPWYPAGSTHVTVPMRVTDSDGVHQVFLMVGRPGQRTLTVQVKACRILAGETETIVAFEYDGVVPSYPNTSLSDPPSHLFFVTATDTEGDSKSVLSGIAQRSPYHVTTLKGQSSDFITSVAFSPDGGLLASRPGNAVRLWDVAARQHVATLDAGDRTLWDVAFSPDGGALAANSGHGRIDLWDVTSGKLVETFGQPGSVHSIAFSPDGGVLAAASDSWIELWDTASFMSPRSRVSDFDGDGEVGFSDFVKFAAKFGFSRGEVGYDPRYDLDRDGTIGFADFLIFAEAFGKKASST